MSSYSFYRLPYSDSFTAVVQSSGVPERLKSYAELSGRTGFVVAPFAISPDAPLLLMRPERVERFALDDVSGRELLREVTAGTTYGRIPVLYADDVSRAAYTSAFAACHDKLSSGEFDKVVLSRRSVVSTPDRAPLHELFLRACELYPRAFVTLFSSEACGTWLVASPEILISGDGNVWHTVALAGTMRYGNGPGGSEWSAKNKREQRCVADYIGDNLRRLSCDVTENAPKTVRAGALVHLRSDFSFRLSGTAGVGDVIAAVHPTPAVCGLPKADTRRFINTVESGSRGYYSGFMGPLAINGETNLYVSLRCMRLADGFCVLYAGGGLLKDSVEEQEWDETEAKMETMMKVIETCQGKHK